ncbi:MAG TPA: hypothetical protein VFW16_10600 [Streptosporangiaceae bacterium]|nr:hypothetical protein [Streptosporangiaceae bacterium]
MSPKNRSDAIKEGARQAAAQVTTAAERAKPLAKSTSEAARRGFLRGRAWAAPQVERSGQVLQDTVAPKVSAVLSEAARRIDPAQPRYRNWRKPVGLATLTATVTAAAGAVAAFLRNRSRPGGAIASAADQAKAARNGQPTTGLGADSEVDSQVKS